jgi:hypothetical protein
VPENDVGKGSCTALQEGGDHAQFHRAQVPEESRGYRAGPGLSADLVLKHLLYLGEFRMAEVAERVKLPVSLVELVLEEHRREKLIEVKGAANYSSLSYLFGLTEAGRSRGNEAMALCRYVGPAPVSLEDYRRMVQSQTVRGIVVGDEELKAAFSHLVVNTAVRRQLGPAMISGQAVLI